MRKKLLLINVVDVKSYENKELVFPVQLLKSWQPLQLGVIAALTPADWDIEIIDENFEEFSFQEADLVGISAYTIGINRAYKIARLYKDKNIPSVVGGMHVTFFPDEALQYADIVAVGKAEGLWSNIIKDYNDHDLKKIYYSDESASICFSPRRDIYKKYNYLVANVMSSLGCLHNCNYCNIPVFNRHNYYLRDIDDVVDEIKKLEQDYFIFNDDDFFGTNEEHRNRIILLFRKMISSGIKKKWQCSASVNIARYPEILKLAHKAGCVTIFVGMESIEAEELDKYNKSFNKKFAADNYESAIRVFHRHKIAVWGSFICGGPNETQESMIMKGRIFRKMKLDNVILLYLTPLPQTCFFKELNQNNKLIYTSFPGDWIYYNFTTLTYKTGHGTAREFFTVYQKTGGALFAPYTGLIKNYRIRKFFLTLLTTASFKTAINANVFFSFYSGYGFNSKFFKVLYKIFKPGLKLPVNYK